MQGSICRKGGESLASLAFVPAGELGHSILLKQVSLSLFFFPPSTSSTLYSPFLAACLVLLVYAAQHYCFERERDLQLPLPLPFY